MTRAVEGAGQPDPITELVAAQVALHRRHAPGRRRRWWRGSRPARPPRRRMRSRGRARFTLGQPHDAHARAADRRAAASHGGQPVEVDRVGHDVHGHAQERRAPARRRLADRAPGHGPPPHPPQLAGQLRQRARHGSTGSAPSRPWGCPSSGRAAGRGQGERRHDRDVRVHDVGPQRPAATVTVVRPTRAARRPGGSPRCPGRRPATSCPAARCRSARSRTCSSIPPTRRQVAVGDVQDPHAATRCRQVQPASSSPPTGISRPNVSAR